MASAGTRTSSTTPLSREYQGFFSKRLNPTGTRDTLPEFRDAMHGSAFDLLELMEESGRVPLIEPRKHDGELLWAEALDEFGRAFQKLNAASPGRFFSTGRQFISPDKMPACRETHWIHGACGSAVIFKPDEVSQPLVETDALITWKMRWSKPGMQEELLRLRALIQEAALARRAIFFYGHD